jgi:hypothetical protein
LCFGGGLLKSQVLLDADGRTCRHCRLIIHG